MKDTPTTEEILGAHRDESVVTSSGVPGHRDEVGELVEGVSQGDEAASRGEEDQDQRDRAFSRRVEEAIEVLRELRDNRRRLACLEKPVGNELLKLAGQVARPGPYAKRELAREVRKRRRQSLRNADESLLSKTGIRKKRRELVYQTPTFGSPPVPPGNRMEGPTALGTSHVAGPADARDGRETPAETLKNERCCYVCKQNFSELHHFYDQMCGDCADFNFSKRHQRADLEGRVALVTGARVKIGYQAAILLLRSGAKVIVTTRFPRDAAQRYAQESDAHLWSDRLVIHGLDLRHTPSVELFCEHLKSTQERLDFIVNNACQTVRRPTGFYQHLVDGEEAPVEALPERAQSYLRSYEQLRSEAKEALVLSKSPSGAPGLISPARLSQLALLAEDREGGTSLFPEGQLDQDLQQVDLRKINSWRLPLDKVSAVELLEVQLVNAVAPFILNARLKELMLREPSADKHIVNVSAMEGQFYRSYKTDKHPHTNMAKAALNMMTRTSAIDYIKSGIHMNSVDTGWVSDEDPVEIAKRKERDHRFHPPLDIVDGAARIVDPIIDGFNTGNHQWGLFLKDYRPVAW